MKFFEPRSGHGLPHSPFRAIVAPRPIGWISTIDTKGRVNLAPYSFFNALAENPPIIAFSSGGRKDTVRNAEATGEFVANLVTRDLVEQMNVTSAAVPAGTDEMALAALAAAPSTMVTPPRVALAAASLECKVLKVSELHDLRGAGTNWFLVTGEVIGIHYDERYLRDGKFDASMARIVARCGYRDYSDTATLFSLNRPDDGPAVLAP